MTRVKVCGITNLQDALMAVELGADALGFVLAPSPRQVAPEQVRDIIGHLPPFVAKVGVFVNAPLTEVRRVLAFCGLNLTQLHGEESPAYCARLAPQAIKAFRVRDDSFLAALPRYHCLAYLLDGYHSGGYGGMGQGFNWGLALRAQEFGRVILSGGLTPENVAQAIREVRPYAVDVSSGVESEPGKKDPERLRAFLAAVREASLERR